MKLPKLKEWHRTIILLVIIALAIGFILLTNAQYESNFTDTF